MHGNVKKNLDDGLPFQITAYFFLQIYSKGDFLKEHTFLDPQWAWVTRHYTCI
jgi:hypothetical protein